MSIHKRVSKTGRATFMVRYRERGVNRAANFDSKKDAQAFESQVRLAKRKGELYQLDAGRVRLADFGQLWWSGTVVESSSGNLAVALASLCGTRGYGFVAVVDPHTSPSNRLRVEELGGSVRVADGADQHGSYLNSRLEYVRELVESQGFAWTNQYGSEANVRAHLEQTGPEIWCQTNERCDVLLCAVSTGGTLAGVSRYLRQRAPGTTIVAVDVAGSVAVGGPPGPRHLVGIGSSNRSTFLIPEDYDEVQIVATAAAVSHCRALAAATSIHLGGSSGAVLAAAFAYFDAHPDQDTAVCVCPDGGDRYATSIYDDSWAAERGLAIQAETFADYKAARVAWTVHAGLDLPEHCEARLAAPFVEQPLFASNA